MPNISTHLMLYSICPRTLKSFPLLSIFQSKRFSSSSPLSPVPTHQHIAHLILDQKSPSQALQTFRWASKLPHFTHDQFTYRALIHKLCASCWFDDVHQVLDEMPNSIGSAPNEDIFVTIIRGLGLAQRIKEVVKVPDWVAKFDVKPSLKIYNSILDVLVKEDIDIAREFYREKIMDCGVKVDVYTFGILMKGLCLTNRIGEGFKLLQAMKSRDVTPNAVNLFIFLGFYAILNSLFFSSCQDILEGIGEERKKQATSVGCEIEDLEENNGIVLVSCKDEHSCWQLEDCIFIGPKKFPYKWLELSRRLNSLLIVITKLADVLCNSTKLVTSVFILHTST